MLMQTKVPQEKIKHIPDKCVFKTVNDFARKLHKTDSPYQSTLNAHLVSVSTILPFTYIRGNISIFCQSIHDVDLCVFCDRSSVRVR